MKAKLCEICGDPMPDGETMFKYHGYSGPCPKPPLKKTTPAPAWHDAPTCAGLWLCFENGYAYAYPEEWDKGFAYGEDSRWYGPIPQDGAKAEGGAA